jgi:cytochrome b561
MGVSLSILHKHLTTPGGTLKEEDFRSMLVAILDSILGVTSTFPDLEFTNALQWATPRHEKIFSEAHEICAYFLLGLISIHIFAVIKHRFFDKPENDVLKRMI